MDYTWGVWGVSSVGSALFFSWGVRLVCNNVIHFLIDLPLRRFYVNRCIFVTNENLRSRNAISIIYLSYVIEVRCRTIVRTELWMTVYGTLHT